MQRLLINLDFPETVDENVSFQTESEKSDESKACSESTRNSSFSVDQESVTPQFVRKRMISKTHMQAFSKSKSLLSDLKGSSTPKVPSIEPARALFNFYDALTDFEKEEVSTYSEIFYLGQNCKKNLGKLTNSEGYYVGLIGDHISYRYEIKSKLGTGNFGQVFSCWDHKLSMQVAVKICRIQENYRKAGESESKILNELAKSDLDSINYIVHKYGEFEFRGHLCLVFEVLGSTLLEFIEKRNCKGLPLVHVRKIAFQLFSALKLLHYHNIVHCDLKPDNILLLSAKRFDVKLIDFGSASREGDVTFEYIQCRPYRAPEILIDAPYNNKIDIWATGCVLAELATGCQLFPAISELQLMKMIIEAIGMPSMEFMATGKRCGMYLQRNGRLKINAKAFENRIEHQLSGLDHKFVEFVLMCLKWNPEERISADSALQQQWILGV